MWTKERIVELLETNDRAVGRALVALHANQTADEQNAGVVIEANGKGFRPQHADIGSSMAKQFINNGSLSAKQIAYWRHRDAKGKMRIAIYANQLLKGIK